MATTIIPKRTSTADKVPEATDLETGEVAVNLSDAKFYAKHTDGSIVNLSGAPEIHTHDISQITNLQTELDSKVESVNGYSVTNITINTDDISEGTNLYFTDSRATSAIKNDPEWNASNWDSAYSWGDHSQAGYAFDSDISTVGKTGSYNDLTNKPDLSALEEVTIYASQSNFPSTGESNKIYIAEDTGYTYRWNGSGYTQLSDQTAIWGEISGTLSNQTDLQNALDGKTDVGHSHSASDVTSGQFSDSRISQSSVTQHESTLTLVESQITDLVHYTSNDFSSDFSTKTTDDLSEGSTNRYYTDSRASSAAPVQSVSGKTGSITLNNTDVNLGNVRNVVQYSQSEVDSEISNAESSANSYTDSQSGISNVSVSGDGNSSIDVTVDGNDGSSQNNSTNTSHTHGYDDLPNDVATEGYADSGDSTTLNSANNYTDSQAGVSNVSVTGDGNSSVSVTVEGNDGSSQSNSTSTSHTHGYADLPNDVATEGYADSAANSAESSANNYTDTQISGLSPVASSGDYADLDGVPSEFTPKAHSHNYSDLPGDVATESYVDSATSNSGNWDTAYDRSVKGVSGDGNSTLTINQQTGSVTTDLSHTHDGRYLRSDTANNYMDFSNNESSNYNQDGRVWFDSSSGLYTVAQNADHSNPALMWSSANFNAGGGLTVSYDNEDHPTLSLSGDSFDSTGNYGNLRARSTTAGDVGLDNVRNVSSYSQSEADSNFASSGHSHGKGDIPGTVAYEDEANTFSEQQTFNSGTNYGGGFVVEYNSNSKSLDFKLA